jgi:hypothetical protein
MSSWKVIRGLCSSQSRANEWIENGIIPVSHIICVQSEDEPRFEIMNIVGCADITDTQVTVALTQPKVWESVMSAQPKLAWHNQRNRQVEVLMRYSTDPKIRGWGITKFSIPHCNMVSRSEINKFEHCWYKSDRILEVLKLFVSAIFEFVKFPTRYEWSNIRGTVQ